ncbi:MAG: PadR family transcriptional regulator [Candidatus Atribacteria bacterium]|nr:PadR family transcriptional regulator [Candidatus Atribacteria bacterium]
MALKHGLLGFLSYGPKSGYQLHKMFFKTVRPTLSIIYRQLNGMAEDGLVEYKRVNQKKYPDKNVFRITKSGRSALESWLKTPMKVEAVREPHLMQMWYASRVDKKHVISNIKAYAAQIKKELHYYETGAAVAIEKNSKGSELDLLYWRLVGDLAIKQDRLFIEWAEEAIKQISGFKESHGSTKAEK